MPLSPTTTVPWQHGFPSSDAISRRRLRRRRRRQGHLFMEFLPLHLLYFLFPMSWCLSAPHRFFLITKTKKELPGFPSSSFLVAGMGFEPHDLRVMSPTSYRTAPPRDIKFWEDIWLELSTALLVYSVCFWMSTPFLKFTGCSHEKVRKPDWKWQRTRFSVQQKGWITAQKVVK